MSAMADSRYQKWSTKKIQDEILRVRLIDLEKEQELCFTLNERAKLTSDRYALAFSYTFLADCYLAVRDNKSFICPVQNHFVKHSSMMISSFAFTISTGCFAMLYMMKSRPWIII